MRWILIALGAVVFAFIGWSKTLDAPAEPAFTLSHDIEIAASPDRVFAVLTDFARYPEWNPYATRVEGKLAIGEVITLEINQDNWEGPLVVHPTLTRLDPGRELGWHGEVLTSGIHDTDHYFQLTPLAEGRTRLHHAEEFRGSVAVLAYAQETTAYTERAFRVMNEALKARVEGVD